MGSTSEIIRILAKLATVWNQPQYRGLRLGELLHQMRGDLVFNLLKWDNTEMEKRLDEVIRDQNLQTEYIVVKVSRRQASPLVFPDDEE